jgi:hypothetical protein
MVAFIFFVIGYSLLVIRVFQAGSGGGGSILFLNGVSYQLLMRIMGARFNKGKWCLCFSTIPA